MTIANIIDPRFIQALQRILTVQVPLAVAAKLHAIKEEIDKIEADYNQIRVDLITKYGNKNPDGSLSVNENGTVHLEKEAMATFSKEMGDLLNKEVQVGKVTVGDLEHMTVSAVEFFHLKHIIQ